MPVKDYNVDPDLNTQISGINIAEGCAPSGINNAIRQLMADVKEEFEGDEGAVSSLRAFIAEEVAKCLKLSGGVMTGEINFNRKTARNIANIEIIPPVGTENGGYIDFHHGGNEADDYTTRIIEQIEKRLDVWAENGLTVNGYPVITSDGGAMTGTLNVANIVSHDNTGEVTIRCGTYYQDGADMVLCGKNHPNLPGAILLRSFNSTGSSTLSLQGDFVGINGAPILTIAASWHSGYDWYIKFSNGLIIQGGYVAINANIAGGYEATHTFGLHIPFSSSFYSALINCNGTGVISGGANSMQPTCFIGRAYGATGSTRTWLGSDWIAIGY